MLLLKLVDHFMRQRAKRILGLALADMGRIERDFVDGGLAAVHAEAVGTEVSIS